MENQQWEDVQHSEVSQPTSPAAELDQRAITTPILEAIDGCKAVLMVRIDHLALECTLIRHDLDKNRGRLTLVEERISEVEDSSHAHTNQLSKLQMLVRSLQHRANETKDGHRCDNLRVVGLPEGAEVSPVFH